MVSTIVRPSTPPPRTDDRPAKIILKKQQNESMNHITKPNLAGNAIKLKRTVIEPRNTLSW